MATLRVYNAGGPIQSPLAMWDVLGRAFVWAGMSWHPGKQLDQFPVWAANSLCFGCNLFWQQKIVSAKADWMIWLRAKQRRTEGRYSRFIPHARRLVHSGAQLSSWQCGRGVPRALLMILEIPARLRSSEHTQSSELQKMPRRLSPSSSLQTNDACGTISKLCAFSLKKRHATAA